MKIKIRVESTVRRTARLLQVAGMFDLPAGAEMPAQEWDVDMPIEGVEWNIGLIVGPSGCGKSTILRHAWPDELERGVRLTTDWADDVSLLDAFPKSMGISEITDLLSAVGFSSPPSWLKPFRVLSNGEQFRVMLARVIAEAKETGRVAVIDEFTSVVDRTVARIGSFAAAKIARKWGVKLVCVTCHDDVQEWLRPDWIYRPAECRWERGSLQPRPSITISIHRAPVSAWQYFAHHHYLTGDINRSAACWVAYVDMGEGPRLAAFTAWLPFVGRLDGRNLAKRGHRSVTLPDFQGLGIAARMVEYVAAMWHVLGFRVFSGTSHPSKIRAQRNNPRWRLIRPPAMSPAAGDRSKPEMDKARARGRFTVAFEWFGGDLGMDKAAAEHLREQTWVTL